eukprot:9486473-Pyramimonas_sp.AAC.1
MGGCVALQSSRYVSTEGKHLPNVVFALLYIVNRNHREWVRKTGVGSPMPPHPDTIRDANNQLRLSIELAMHIQHNGKGAALPYPRCDGGGWVL